MSHTKPEKKKFWLEIGVGESASKTCFFYDGLVKALGTKDSSLYTKQWYLLKIHLKSLYTLKKIDLEVLIVSPSNPKATYQIFNSEVESKAAPETCGVEGFN